MEKQKRKIVVCDLKDEKRIFYQENFEKKEEKATREGLPSICTGCDAYRVCGGSTL